MIADVDTTKVKVTNLEECPFNPRTEYESESMKALVESIKTEGIIQPIIARRKNKSQYEVICGHRRLRAAKKAGIDSVNIIVRDMTDEQALDVMLTENLQRADLTPIEEAESFDKMIKNGRTPVQIASLIGKKEAYVTKRRSLVYLHKDIIKAMKDKNYPLPLGYALLIARVPDVMQNAALTLVWYSDDKQRIRSVDEFNHVLSKNLFIPLKLAQFDITNPMLTDAPPCLECPSYAGNKQGLFDELGGETDICTNPKCFNEKTEEHWKLLVANSASKGVLSEEDLKEMWGYTESKAVGNKKFISLDAPVAYDKKSRTIREILGKDVAALSISLARSPREKIICEFAPRKEIIELLAEHGIKEPEKDVKEVKKEKAAKESKKAEREEKKLTKEVHEHFKKTVSSKMVDLGTVGPKVTDFLRGLATVLLVESYQGKEILEGFLAVFPTNHDEKYKFISDFVRKMPLHQVTSVLMALTMRNLTLGMPKDYEELVIGFAEKFTDMKYAYSEGEVLREHEKEQAK